MIKGVDHIGLAVQNAEEVARFYGEILGLPLTGQEEPEVRPERGVKLLFLPAGQTQLELLEPLSDEGPVAKLLRERGEGIHHIAFEVEDIAQELRRLAERGVRLVDAEPSHGSRDTLIAFVHPKACHGVLVELVQHTAAGTK